MDQSLSGKIFESTKEVKHENQTVLIRRFKHGISFATKENEKFKRVVDRLNKQMHKLREEKEKNFSENKSLKKTIDVHKKLISEERRSVSNSEQLAKKWESLYSQQKIEYDSVSSDLAKVRSQFNTLEEQFSNVDEKFANSVKVLKGYQKKLQNETLEKDEITFQLARERKKCEILKMELEQISQREKSPVVKSSPSFSKEEYDDRVKVEVEKKTLELQLVQEQLEKKNHYLLDEVKILNEGKSELRAKLEELEENFYVRKLELSKERQRRRRVEQDLRESEKDLQRQIGKVNNTKSLVDELQEKILSEQKRRMFEELEKPKVGKVIQPKKRHSRVDSKSRVIVKNDGNVKEILSEINTVIFNDVPGILHRTTQRQENFNRREMEYREVDHFQPLENGCYVICSKTGNKSVVEVLNGDLKDGTVCVLKPWIKRAGKTLSSQKFCFLYNTEKKAFSIKASHSICNLEERKLGGRNVLCQSYEKKSDKQFWKVDKIQNGTEFLIENLSSGLLLFNTNGNELGLIKVPKDGYIVGNIRWMLEKAF